MAEASEVDEREQLKQKLLSRMVKADGPLDTQCWIWTWGQDGAGYGHVWWKGKVWGTHRLSYIVFVGPIPPNLDCLHHCDDKACIRPNHLYLGTDLDNVNDRIRRGRSKHYVGEAHCSATLTEVEVSHIKFLALEEQLSLSQIGELYGTTYGNVFMIKKGLSWKHVEPVEPPSLPWPKLENFKRRV